MPAAARLPPHASFTCKPHGVNDHISGAALTSTNRPNQMNDQPQAAYALREQRLQQLMENCQDQILGQIIGPFGLTPAMFADQDGGNVTTQRNAGQGIFANASEQLKRTDYDYAAARKKVKQDAVRNGTMNSQKFVDAYTGKTETTMRTGSDGKRRMNAEADHFYAVKDLHREGGWMLDKNQRSVLASTEENLHLTTMQTNRSKGAKAPDAFFTQEEGFSDARIAPLRDKARAALEKTLPDTLDRAAYHGKALIKEGGTEAGKNAVRQALGILLHEFVTGSIAEVAQLLRDKHSQRSFIDQLIDSLKRVMGRVASKAGAALDAALHGSLQGLATTLLTFVINHFITTAAKIVSLIRTSIQSLWQAIRLLASTPQSMSATEKARAVTKIIAGIVSAGLGLMLEESVKGILSGFPLLAPIAGMLSAAVTAIISGLCGAVIIYGIDRLYDWSSSTGTELLVAQENLGAAQTAVAARLESLISLQFETSRLYAVCAAENQQIELSLAVGASQMEAAAGTAAASVKANAATIAAVQAQRDRQQRLAAALRAL
ncbi:hypothetical protein INH39_18060 [Massilia violaceinigra]|uniref:Uncharacterized protein n=1 Tax=Massilia violaceinigra TaxID=2045208 RepID=A0ABY3ZYA5_9BURK|nr:hypothetical protein [Massilia violaceinigra]UOD27436.1 hypothetical protein INH39_18060 [Massilia violaceinigra]